MSKLYACLLFALNIAPALLTSIVVQAGGKFVLYGLLMGVHLADLGPIIGRELVYHDTPTILLSTLLLAVMWTRHEMRAAR